jgi:endonuclease/exonuclease/phosphatase family metal-dependent hydrolase
MHHTKRSGTLILIAVAIGTWILPGCDLQREDVKKELVQDLEKAAEDGRLQQGLRAITNAWQGSPAPGQPNNAPGAPARVPQGYSQSPAPGQVPGQLVSTAAPAATPLGVPPRSPQTVLIASFNIQAFGEKKIGVPATAERIAAIINCFDVVAIQEVRALDQSVIPQLIQYINARGARYDFILGPRLGRTSSKEQYCYIFDTSRINSGQNASYTVDNQADLLHRTPLVARFMTRVPQGYRPFSFSLINIHTDPDEVKLELPVMHTVLQAVREYEWSTAGEDDVILMGDLNAAPKIFGNLGKVPNIYWTIRDQPTNTRRTQCYDNMLFDGILTNEFTSRAGVLDMSTMFGISIDEALKISDHNPIWAEFTIIEQPLASGPSQSGSPPATYSAANPYGMAPNRPAYNNGPAYNDGQNVR